MISIIMPVYNEEKDVEKNVSTVTKFMEKYDKNYEIVVVDDGCVDDTVRIVKKLIQKNGKIRLVRHPKNMGVGAALRTGLKSSRGGIIISIDSDLTYGPDNFPNLINAMKKNNADIVIGTPYASGFDQEIPLFRRMLSRGANYVDQFIFGLNFSTPTCLFRAWKRKAAKDVRITFDRFEGISESAVDAFNKGYKIVEVPARYRMKAGRVSRMSVNQALYRHLKMLFKLKTKTGKFNR